MEVDVVLKSGELRSLTITSFVMQDGVLKWIYSPFNYGPVTTEKGEIKLDEVESITVTSSL